VKGESFLHFSAGEKPQVAERKCNSCSGKENL